MIWAIQKAHMGYTDKMILKFHFNLVFLTQGHVQCHHEPSPHPTFIRSWETHWDHFWNDLSKTKGTYGVPLTKMLVMFHFNLEFLTQGHVQCHHESSPHLLGVGKHIGTALKTIWARQKALLSIPTKMLVKFHFNLKFLTQGHVQGHHELSPTCIRSQKTHWDHFWNYLSKTKGFYGVSRQKCSWNFILPLNF